MFLPATAMLSGAGANIEMQGLLGDAKRIGAPHGNPNVFPYSIVLYELRSDADY
jgi:hypothetical protein